MKVLAYLTAYFRMGIIPLPPILLLLQFKFRPLDPGERDGKQPINPEPGAQNRFPFLTREAAERHAASDCVFQ